MYKSVFTFFFLAFCLTLCLSSTWLMGQSSDFTRACAPFEVNFFGPSGQSAYFWDFGDGSVSLLQNPTHIYVAAGDYEVSLREGENGALIGTIDMEIYQPPSLEIDIADSVFCAPFLAQFENVTEADARISLESLLWIFGDGNSERVIGSDMVSHLYDNLTGTVNLGLTWESSTPNCTVTQTFEEFLTIGNPQAAFATDPENPSRCTPPLTVAIDMNNSSEDVVNYSWDFGQGQSSNAELPGSATYAVDGFYSIVLAVSDSLGCTDTARQLVSIGGALASFELPDTVCTGELITISNLSSPGDYTWDFDGATLTNSPDASNPIIVFPQAGNYDISLSVSVENGLCVQDTTLTVTAVELSNISFESDPSRSCEDSLIVSFTANVPSIVDEVLWTFWDSTFSTELNPMDTLVEMDTNKYFLNEEQTFTTRLVATSRFGCSATFEKADTIRRPEARFMPDISRGCVPLTVTFADSSMSHEDITQWEWDFGDGTVVTVDNDEDQIHTYTQPGDYMAMLTITNAEGCVDSSFCISIHVGDSVAIDVTLDKTALCAGEELTLTNNTADEYHSWSFHINGGPAKFCAADSETSTIVLDSGVYDIFLEFDNNGCITRDTLRQIVTVEGIDPYPYYETNCDSPRDVFFADSSGIEGTRSWTLDGNVISDQDSFTYTFPDTGSYVITLEVQLSGSACPPTRDSVHVEVREIESRFVLDTFQCIKSTVDLIGNNSVDVYNSCHRGYKWIFTDQRPITTMYDTIKEHSFSDTGLQTVTLVVNDINGCTDTSSQTVRVFDLTANFEFAPTPFCVPADVQFTDLSIGDTTITEWAWNIGGQEFMEANPLVSFVAAPPNPSVSLTVTDAVGCVHMISNSLMIYTPESSILTTPASGIICSGESVLFSATDFTDQGSFLTFDWDFGNGQSSTNQSEEITYDSPGVYIVTLSYTENSTGCMGTSSTQIVVQDPPMVSFVSDPDNSQLICAPAVINFENTTPDSENYSFSWDFGNGSTSFLENPTEAFGPGVYDVTLVVSNEGGCSDSLVQTYQIGGSSGDFTVDPDAFCEGEDVTFTLIDTMNVSSWAWDFGNGASQDNTSPVTISFDTVQAGSVVARLLLFSSDGCELAVEKSLNIDAINVDYTFNVTLDQNCDPIVFFNGLVQTGLGNFDVEWDFGDGESSSELSPSHRFETSGSYEVTLTVMTPIGCVESVTKTVNVNRQSGGAGYRANALFALDFCLVPWQFSDSSDVSTLYELDFGDGSDTTFTAPGWVVDHNFPLEGNYTVRLVTTNSNGCIDTFERVITVERNPDFAGGALMPLAFSPNGDQMDDRLVPYVEESFRELLTIESFRIWNRWGGLVYDNENGNQGWNGNESNGDPAPTEVYFYIITGNVQGCEFKAEGDVTLVR